MVDMPENASNQILHFYQLFKRITQRSRVKDVVSEVWITLAKNGNYSEPSKSNRLTMYHVYNIKNYGNRYYTITEYMFQSLL